jgi:hypothetical protein
MKINIIIDYLQETDYNQPACKCTELQLEKLGIVRCENSDDIKNTILGYGQFDEDVFLTILSHGHERGLAKETWESLITWCELLELINRCKENHKITLNLLSVCNSNSIQISANFCNHKIDEIWVTTSEVVSISKSLLALNASSFDDFNEQLEEDERVLYENIVL